MNEYCVHRYGGQFIQNRYGPGVGRIWLDDVQCTGTETNLADCRHSSWGINNCYHKEDVSISCNTAVVTTPTTTTINGLQLPHFLVDLETTIFNMP